MHTHWPDFDELIEIAKQTPHKLDELLALQVEELIESAPEHMRARLRGIQFQVNCQREISKNSMDACLKISNMMQTSLQKLTRALNTFHSNDMKEEEPQVKAKVYNLQAAN